MEKSFWEAGEEQSSSAARIPFETDSKGTLACVAFDAQA